MLLCSLYDFYNVDEDGMLEDILDASCLAGYSGKAPVITQVSNATEALAMLEDKSGMHFELVICMSTGECITFSHFAEKVHGIQPDLAVAVLTHNREELGRINSLENKPYRLFNWMGSGEIIQGIIQLTEDTENAAHDCGEMGVPCVLLVEDDVLFYSKYLHQGMREIRLKSHRILEQMKSQTMRKLKCKARTKVLLAVSMEEAEEILNNFSNSLVGVVTDMRFHQEGIHRNNAGVHLIEKIRAKNPLVPIILQTSESDGEVIAESLGVGYLSKQSPTLVADFGKALVNILDFGDLHFRNEKGKTLRKISGIRELSIILDKLPAESIRRVWLSGQLSRWVKIQTELELAENMAECIREDCSAEEVKLSLVNAVKSWNSDQRRGYVVPYSRSFHEEDIVFSRLGSGSMGGKGRGLAFVDRVLAANLEENTFKKVTVSIPSTLTITTEFFDEFMKMNKLHRFAIECDNDNRIHRTFQKASLPPTILGDLRDYVKTVTTPLAVRSSSLLEDAIYQPFAGIYATKMLPNNSRNLTVRFKQLSSAIKFVYASTFIQSAKSYIKATGHRVEEEKMAVLLQPVAGRQYENLFYPHFSGVGRSYNFYPVGSAKPEDGVVNVALGLGKTIVDGGVSLRFTPDFPRVFPQFGTIKDMMNNSQKQFYSVQLDKNSWGSKLEEDQFVTSRNLATSEKDGTLEFLGSTYDVPNDRVMDGITTPGPRVVSFAHILKNKVFPLADISNFLLKMGEKAMGCSVEIEFAVTLGRKRALPARFSLLQIRPMVVNNDLVNIDLEALNDDNLLCTTDTALGNGSIRNITDVVYIKPDSFTAAKTKEVAEEVEAVNKTLSDAGRNFILIGPGRWGSSDPWLGIPVTWNQISGAKVIVEAGQKNMNIDPSQGSHFFQNMTSLGVVYFTVPYNRRGSIINWNRLETMKTVYETQYIRHVSSNKPMKIVVDGRTGKGAILTG